MLSTVAWDSTNHPNGGNWDTGSNWIGGSVPGTGDDAVINLNSSATITHSSTANDSVLSLTIGNSSTSLQITGGSLTLGSGSSSLGGTVEVESGGTLTVGAGANVLIRQGQTLTVSGTLNLNGANSFAIEDMSYSSTAGIVVNGTMSVTNTTLSRSGNGSDNTLLQVNAGGHLTATGSTFNWDNLYLANGSVLSSGDLTNNIFNTTVSAPALDIPLLTNNQSFQDIDILSGSLASGQSLVLNPLGTATTANQRYVFPSGFTVQSGTTLTVGAGANVLIRQGQTLMVSGTLNLNGANSFAIEDMSYSSTAGIIVNGTMSVTNTTLSRSGNGSDNTLLQVNAGGHLTATGSTLNWDNLYLANGSVLNSGDLTNNIFNITISAPALDIPLLTNNQSFQDIDILSGSLASGQSLALNPIGTATTANQRYVFPNGFTVQGGGSLTVGAGANVLIRQGQTLTVSGTLNLSGANSFAIEDMSYSSTAGIVVNGTMSVTNTTLSRSGNGSDNTLLQVNAGGHLTATGSTFNWDNLYLANGSVLSSGDLTNNIFNTTVSAPALDIPLLTNNQSFQDIDILSGSLASGQSLALNPLGMATTANQRYVFPSGFTVQSGTTLTVGAGANVLIRQGQTLTVSGTLNLNSANSFAIEDMSYSSTAGIVVNGTMSVTNTTLSRSGNGSDNTLLQVNAGGHLTAIGSTLNWDNVYLASNSNAILSHDVLSTTLNANSGATINAHQNDFSNGDVVASGSSTATIDLTFNYWGTNDDSQILSKITDRHTNANLPTVNFAPSLPAPPTTLRVVSVEVDSTNWSPAFLSALQKAGEGDGLGYSIASGSAIQYASIPWGDVNQIRISFNEDANVQENSLILSGVNVPQYAFTSFTNFNYESGTHTAVWTLAAPLGTDKITLDLKANGLNAVTDTSGAPLDGDWTNGVSIFPSGNGIAGSDFNFTANVLIGDANQDGIINGQDLAIISSNWLKTGLSGDVNADGIVNGQDLALVSSSWLSATPQASVVPAAQIASASTTPQNLSAIGTVTALAVDSIVSAEGSPRLGNAAYFASTSPAEASNRNWTVNPSSFGGPIQPGTTTAFKAWPKDTINGSAELKAADAKNFTQSVGSRTAAVVESSTPAGGVEVTNSPTAEETVTDFWNSFVDDELLTTLVNGRGHQRI